MSPLPFDVMKGSKVIFPLAAIATTASGGGKKGAARKSFTINYYSHRPPLPAIFFGNQANEKNFT